MGASQRRKGATYEREVAQAFSDAFGVRVTRNLEQVRDGGKDLQVGPLVIECKRRKQLATWQGWLDQAQRACAREPGPFGKEMPVVVMRPDLGRSMVLVGLEDFLALCAPEVRRRMAGGAIVGRLPDLPTGGADLEE